MNESLSRVGSTYARAYVQPLSTSLGTNLNSGLLRIPMHEDEHSGLSIYFGVKAFGTMVPEEDRTFDLTYNDRVTVNTRVGGENVSVLAPATFTVRNAPSIFGSAEAPSATVSVRHDTTVSFIGVRMPVSFDTTFTVEMIGGLIETGVSPLLVPEVEVGTLLATSLMVRWLPRFAAAEIGSLGIRGIGVRHNMRPYLRTSLLDVSLHAFWQELTADDADDDQVVLTRTSALGIALGRTFGALRLYSGLQIEESTVDVSYEYLVDVDGESQSIPISFTERSGSRVRMTLGAGLRAGPTILSFDAGFGAVRVLTVGLGFVLD